eukprot:93815-Chlamydomonas_euryale.AAC.1
MLRQRESRARVCPDKGRAGHEYAQTKGEQGTSMPRQRENRARVCTDKGRAGHEYAQGGCPPRTAQRMRSVALSFPPPLLLRASTPAHTLHTRGYVPP